MSIISTPASIYPDVNNNTNSTRVMEVGSVYSNSITDGIATIEGGYVTGLVEPTEDNQIATKYYVDNSSGEGSGGAAGPVNSVQYNSNGEFAGSANLMVDTTSETLTINGVLTNGTISLLGSQIEGLNDPTTPTQAATKHYADLNTGNMGNITVNLVQNVPYAYTAEQVYNNIINLTFIPNNYTDICPVDDMPSAVDMQTFLGSEFVIGKSWTTIFIMPMQGNQIVSRLIGGGLTGTMFNPISYAYCGFPEALFATANFCITTIISTVTSVTSGSPQYYCYVMNNFTDVTTNAQITDQGILTPSWSNLAFNVTTDLSGISSIAYPIPANPVMSSSTSITYTYANLAQFLIIREGLTSSITDTFVPASTIAASTDFVMGGGTFRFFIQNPTAYSLTLAMATGWTLQTGSTSVIPAGNCGAFWVNVVLSPPSCMLYSMGINPING